MKDTYSSLSQINKACINRVKMIPVKTYFFTAFFVILLVYSTHAYFVSEKISVGSQTISEELIIPELELNGDKEPVAFCRAIDTQFPFEIGPINEYGNGFSADHQIKSVEVFTCEDVSTTSIISCNVNDVERICRGADLKVLLSPSSNDEEDASRTHFARGVLLRVVYWNSEMSATPSVLLTITQHQSHQSTHFNHLSSLTAGSEPQHLQDVFKHKAAHYFERNATWRINWPDGVIGQTSGVAILDEKFVYVFHRGDRVWSYGTFDGFKIRNTSPIPTDTILKCEVKSGECSESVGGKNKFLLPHGISVSPDKKELLLTDVGTHQVYMLNIEDGSERLVLGTFGEPLEGDTHSATHFCQPADAEMDSQTGMIFVADGYCNKRVAVFHNNGTFHSNIMKCGGTDFNVVHDVAIDEKNRQLFVADRENGRICIYSIEAETFGQYIKAIKSNKDGAIFAVDYNPGFLYSVEVLYSVEEAFGNVIQMTQDEGEQGEQFSDSDMKHPHDLSVLSNHVIFITDLESPAKVFKFIKH